MLEGYQWVSWVLIFGVFYFFLIRPEQKKQKKVRSMLSEIKEGDKVLTRGGIYGKIVSLDGDRMVIESSSARTKLEMAKTAVFTVLDAEGNPVQPAKK
jgi:preprotein translocase subunit YajC